MKDITLVFPQWQGSIDNGSIYEGPHELAEKITGLPDIFKVDVKPLYPLEKHGLIAGKEEILSHFNEVQCFLEDEKPDRILMLGGDCSTAVVPAAWLNAKHDGNLALLWLDAHPDLNTPQTSNSGRMQGMALASLLGLYGDEIIPAGGKKFENKQVFLTGARVFDPPELDFIASNKLFFSGPGELERDPSWLIKNIQEKGFDKVYIHLDVDAIAPMGFPHGKPCPPGGMQFSNVLKVIEEIQNSITICGLGITEFHAGNEWGPLKARKLIQTALNNFLQETTQ